MKPHDDCSTIWDITKTGGENSRMRAYVIGNGESRRDYDLDRLGHDVTFGCNALYGDWWPTYLVAIDPKMIQEIRESDFPDDRFIEPPEEEKWEPIEVNPARPRSNAGMNAMAEAIRMGYDDLWCIGFDFLIHDEFKSVSNMYDGTPCYGPETRASYRDNVGRVNFLKWFVRKHSSVNFNFVVKEEVRDDLYMLHKLFNNFLFRTYKDMP